MKTWLQDHKVFILGMISAICMAVVEFTVAPTVDWIVVGYAAFVAAGSYLARNLRGQWATIAGIMLTCGANIYSTINSGGHVNVSQILLMIAVNIGLALASPPKNVGYEKSPVIEHAKEAPNETPSGKPE